MPSIKLKITEDDHNVNIEIEIKPKFNLQALVDYISKIFDLTKPGTKKLFHTNDNWKRLQELTGDYALTPFVQVIQQPYQKFIFVHSEYNYEFQILMVGILDEPISLEFPFLLKKEGNLPHITTQQLINSLKSPSSDKPAAPKAKAATKAEPEKKEVVEDDDDLEEDDEDAHTDDHESEELGLDHEEDGIGDEDGFGTEGEMDDDTADDDEFGSMDGEDEDYSGSYADDDF